jgi:hypothetical protein
VVEPDRSSLFLHDSFALKARSTADPLLSAVPPEGWSVGDAEERTADIPGFGRLLEEEVSGGRERQLIMKGTVRWGRPGPGSFWRTAELWTADDIMVAERLRDGCLVFLSACEAGIRGLDHVDEQAGLVAAFQMAGAGTLVNALWPVEEEAAALYVELFYRSLATEMGDVDVVRLASQTAERLRCLEREEAVRTLRELLERSTDADARAWLLRAIHSCLKGPPTPFAHPYDWAAFQVAGNGTATFAPEVKQ